MTSRERMRTAIAGGKPDRIPVAMVADFDFYCKAAGPAHVGVRIRRQRRPRRHSPGRPLALPRERFHLRLDRRIPRPRATARRVRDGRGAALSRTHGHRRAHPPQAPPHRRPPARAERRAHHFAVRLCRRITCEADIDRVLGPVPTAQDLLDQGIYEPHEILRRELGDRAYICVPAHGMFPDAIEALGGFEAGMLALSRAARSGPRSGGGNGRPPRRPPRSRRAKRRGRGLDRRLPGRGGYDLRRRCGGKWPSPDIASWSRSRASADCKPSSGSSATACPCWMTSWNSGIDALVIEQNRRGYSSDPVEVRRRVGRNLCVYGWNWELDFIEDRRDNITQRSRAPDSRRGNRGRLRDGHHLHDLRGLPRRRRALRPRGSAPQSRGGVRAFWLRAVYVEGDGNQVGVELRVDRINDTGDPSRAAEHDDANDGFGGVGGGVNEVGGIQRLQRLGR